MVGDINKVWYLKSNFFLSYPISLLYRRGLEQSDCVGRRGHQARVVQGRRSQQETISPRLFGVFAQRLEIPQLADGHAKLVEEPGVEDYISG